MSETGGGFGWIGITNVNTAAASDAGDLLVTVQYGPAPVGYVLSPTYEARLNAFGGALAKLHSV